MLRRGRRCCTEDELELLLELGSIFGMRPRGLPAGGGVTIADRGWVPAHPRPSRNEPLQILMPKAAWIRVDGMENAEVIVSRVREIQPRGWIQTLELPSSCSPSSPSSRSPYPWRWAQRTTHRGSRWAAAPGASCMA